jgi:hypothetical protein
MNLTSLVSQVQSALTDDLRRAPWRGSPDPLAGHCYVACEAVYHASGQRLRPTFVRHEGAPHWYLRTDDGQVIDPTAGQFKTPVPYDLGRGKGFLTRQPSKRAAVVLARIGASNA